MNEQQFKAKMEKDGNRVKKDFSTYVGDNASQLKEEFDQFSGTVKDNVNETTSMIKKQVGLGLEKYNSKAQETVDGFKGGISQNVKKYPWVVISLGLIFGFILGALLKPSHQSG